jgi:hypothetical protein
MRAKFCLFRGALTFSVLFLFLPVICRAQVIISPGTAALGGFTDPSRQEAGRFMLSPSALQVAHIIGVEPLIMRLSSLAASKDIGDVTGMSLEELSLRQQITEAVVVASLDVDDVFDRIDYERAQIIELRDILRSNRDRAVGTTSVATLAIGTGLGVISGVLQFSDTTKGAGNAIGFAAGGISTLLSFHSIRQQRSGKRPAWVFPDMLSPLFGVSQEQQGSYPNTIWTYLNSAPPGGTSQASRRARILEEWKAANRFDPLDSPQGKAKIALLTDTKAANKKLSIDLLSERSAMLADVRNELSSVKRELRDLLRGVRVNPTGPKLGEPEVFAP